MIDQFTRVLLFLLVYIVISLGGAPMINESFIDNDKEVLTRRYPQAIIIGVKKSGTRALLEFLKINKKIKAPGPEVHYFDKHYNKGLDWYRLQMPETTANEITIEKSPGYFVNKLAPQRVHALNSKMKLIIVVRNPITRAISDYTQAKSRKVRSLKSDFEEMATCGEKNKKNCVDGINSGWGAIKIGIYHKYLQNWLEYFPLSQILFIDGEKLISNPAIEVNRAEKFLDLVPVVTEANFVKDPVKGFPCLKYEDNHVHCLGKTKGRRHPKVKRSVTVKMEQFYQKENEKFFKLIHKKFDWV
uniref:Sulfotransfer_1 domain-containing protein n=1 Tax=Rhabditophanes sp. KR3021 TaxID=114890 RepID=A0AC35U695_9BILA